MVVTHWETSTRPLFVRAIWRDGHHVLFQPEEPKPAPRSARTATASRPQGLKFFLVGLRSGRLREKAVQKTRSAEVDESVAAPPPFSYHSYCLDQVQDSLTDRVLLWLDLAVPELRKRIVSAGPAAVPKSPKVQRRQEAVPELEESVEVVVVKEPPRRVKKTAGAKRQLHVFLPNFPKCSENSSLISSRKSAIKT